MDITPPPDSNSAQGGASQASNPASVANTAATSHPATAANYDSKTIIKGGSVEAMKEQFPEFYDKFIQGMAQTICNQMKDSQERMKKEGRKHRSS